MARPIDIKDGILALKICLKKSWAKKATYWVEVWKISRKLPNKTLTRWVYSRTWEWPKRDNNSGKTEIVSGSVPSEEFSDFFTAFEKSKDATGYQLDRDYTIDMVKNHVQDVANIQEDINKMNLAVREYIQLCSNTLCKPISMILPDNSSVIIDSSSEYINTTNKFENKKKEVESKSSFKDAQAKRAKKARW